MGKVGKTAGREGRLSGKGGWAIKVAAARGWGVPCAAAAFGFVCLDVPASAPSCLSNVSRETFVRDEVVCTNVRSENV